MADGVGNVRDVIDALGKQFSCHFTIEDYSDSFFANSASLTDDWKSEGIEKDLEVLATQLHSKWKIIKDPLLNNVYRIQEADIDEAKNNPLNKSLDSFKYDGNVDGLRNAIVQLEPSISPSGIIDESSIHIYNGKVSVDKGGIHINYNPLPVSMSVGRSSIRDILTSHLPVDQFGPILWYAKLYQEDGKCGCILYYGTFPLRDKEN